MTAGRSTSETTAHTPTTSAVRIAGGRRQWNLTPASPKVIYDEESFKKGLYKLFYAPSDLLLLLFRSTKGFSMLIKCRRDIGLKRAHYKRQSRGRIWMILTESWLSLGPFGPLFIFVVYQLPMYKVKPFKCCEM